MKANQIEIGKYYRGGNGDVRKVLRGCFNPRFIEWGDARDELPLGGYVKSRTSSIDSFAKWAAEEVADRFGHPAPGVKE